MVDLKQAIYTVNEAFHVLKSCGLTKNEQIVRRWIRGEVPGKELKSIPPPKNATKIGYKIKKDDLEAFILKHTKTSKFCTGNEKVTRTNKEEMENLKQKLKKLEEENTLLKLSNKKSNENSEVESLDAKNNKNKFSNDVNQTLIRNDKSNRKLTDKEIDNMRDKKYEEAKKDKPLEELTWDDYDRLSYTLASLYAESIAAKQEIIMLKELIDELELLAGQKVVKKEDRMVLKGIGVSIGQIMKHLPIEKDTIRRLEIIRTRMDVIEIKFIYNKVLYTADVKEMQCRSGIPTHWSVRNMVKAITKRQVKEATVDKIAHDVIKKTFEKLYDLEQENNKSFYYLI